MENRIEKAKTHLRENWKYYAVGGGCLIIGAVVGAIAYRGRSIGNVNVRQNIAYKSPVTVENITEVHLVRRGHPGNVIRCNETGEVFASQKRAADLLKINQGEISRNVRGLQPNAGGLTFSVLGEARS